MSFDYVDMLGLGIGPSLNLTTKLKALAVVAMGASAVVTEKLLVKLMAAGLVSMPDIPSADMPDAEDREEMVDALLSEFDLSDEDEVFDVPDEPLPRHVYSIRVKEGAGGSLICLPPYSEWTAAKPGVKLGWLVLNAYSKRMRTYRIIGNFLAREHAAELRMGPEALAQLQLVQKSFASQCLKSEKGIEADDVKAPDLSRILNYCDLRWDDGIIPGKSGVSMPIRKLFQAQEGRKRRSGSAV